MGKGMGLPQVRLDDLYWSSHLGEPCPPSSPSCDIAQVHSTHTAIITYDDLTFVLLSTGGLVCVCVQMWGSS